MTMAWDLCLLDVLGATAFSLIYLRFDAKAQFHPSDHISYLPNTISSQATLTRRLGII